MADAGRYRTVAGPGEAALEVRGSRFLGRVAPAEDRAAAEAFVEAVAAEHPAATHVVPAYRVRVVPDRPAAEDPAPDETPVHERGFLREWSSDAGEPSGSAGKPALNVLARRDLEGVVAVVVRYFGGTKLGVGGLARSYGAAVSLAVDDAGVEERRPRRRVVLEVTYDDSGTVRGILTAAGVDVDAAYDETVRFDVRVPVDEAPALLDRLRSATSGRVAVTDADE